MRLDRDRVQEEIARLDADKSKAEELLRPLTDLVEKCKQHLVDVVGLAESDLPNTPIGRPPAERTTTVATIR